jgi:hypothetical protein
MMKKYIIFILFIKLVIGDVYFNEDYGGIRQACSQCLGLNTFNCIANKQDLFTKWSCNDYRYSGTDSCYPYWGGYSLDSAKNYCDQCEGYLKIIRDC